MRNIEEREQIAVINYVKYIYPKVIINHHLGGLKLTIGQAVKAKNLGSAKAFPDLFIYEPNNKYHGLAIEMKATGTKLKKKNGRWATRHIMEQAQLLSSLKEKGYYAIFCCGANEAIETIDQYMKGKL